MRYIKFNLGNGYCGCEATEFETYEDSTLDESIEFDFQQMVRDHGESYEYVASGWGEDFESEEEEEDYYNGCYDNSNWEEISEEEYLFEIENY